MKNNKKFSKCEVKILKNWSSFVYINLYTNNL